MTVDLLLGLLGWSTLINFGLLLWWSFWLLFAHDFIYRMQTDGSKSQWKISMPFTMRASHFTKSSSLYLTLFPIWHYELSCERYRPYLIPNGFIVTLPAGCGCNSSAARAFCRLCRGRPRAYIRRQISPMALGSEFPLSSDASSSHWFCHRSILVRRNLSAYYTRNGTAFTGR